MGTLQLDFERAASEVHYLCAKPTNKELLSLYGLYKQAMVGNNDTEAPWYINVKERSKWDAWNNLWGLHAQNAAEKYIRLVSDLKDRYGEEGFCPV